VKILLVTGQLAQDTVKSYAQQSSQETETVALKIAVAAFLTPKRIVEELQCHDLSSFDLIVVPGLVRGDTKLISEATGIAAVKGPRYAADLPTVLDMINEVQLSTTIPACDLLREKIAEKALQEIQNTEIQRGELLKKPGSILIGNIAVGPAFPMRVLAEIVDAPQMDKETIQATAKRFMSAGASFIDVGMVAGESQPEKAADIVRWVKQVVDVPVSIDTLDSDEIKAAIKAGAELVLSGDAGNIEDIAPYAKDVAVVVIPTNQRQGHFPRKAQDRVEYVEEIIAKAKRLGIKRCIADLIVEPNDILESYLAYREFAARNPDVPMFVGVSNVTELFDADSVGLNAILARLSSEVGGSILLATEKSTKAKGTVQEEVTAAKMMFLAKKRDSVPKDLGIDLLILKDKRSYEEPYDGSIEAGVNVVVAHSSQEPIELDKAGVFKIAVDRTEGLIVAAHYVGGDMSKPLNIVKGKTAQVVYLKVLELKLLSNLDHASYLGVELAKAETALRTGKEYVQDAEMFKKVTY
jgi:dihydropteroate synthase-like protein